MERQNEAEPFGSFQEAVKGKRPFPAGARE